MNDSRHIAGQRQFASDNWAGISPAALNAIIEANLDHSPSYGDDALTLKACDKIRELFETDCEVFFVFNGTAANALALATLCSSYNAVIAHEFAHVGVDECNAPQFFSGGAAILPVSGAEGKLHPAELVERLEKRTDLHFPSISAITLAQATEVGTVYTVSEIGALCETARKYDLRVHMDGARLANAIAHLNTSPSQVTWKAGVDVLSFGMTKNGIAFGEAVVFFSREWAQGFEHRCKQAGQLASKMRFVGAQWAAMLEGGNQAVWLANARCANVAAAKLADRIGRVAGLEILYPVQTNAVFAKMPRDVAAILGERGWEFHEFAHAGGYRLMCAWDTSEAEVDAFIEEVKRCMQNG